MQDPHSELKFVYFIRFDTHNLDAVGVIELPVETLKSIAAAKATAPAPIAEIP